MNAQALILAPDGDEGRAIAFVMPRPKDRVDGQKEGESQFVNHETGNTITHSADGTTTHTSAGDIIIRSAGIVHINPA